MPSRISREGTSVRRRALSRSMAQKPGSLCLGLDTRSRSVISSTPRTPPKVEDGLWILPELWKTPPAFPTAPWTALRAAHRLHRPDGGGRLLIRKNAPAPRNRGELQKTQDREGSKMAALPHESVSWPRAAKAALLLRGRRSHNRCLVQTVPAPKENQAEVSISIRSRSFPGLLEENSPYGTFSP
jgi:hypothetical protein